MHKPKQPLTKEAKEHLKSKLNRMDRRQRKKTEKRLEMYDRGFRADKTEFRIKREKDSIDGYNR